DPDVAALLRAGWDPALALRIARRTTPPATADTQEPAAARALLGHWLGLADSVGQAGLRNRLVRCALRLCPGPWSADEVAVFARHSGTVTDAFDAATGAGEAAGATGRAAREEEPGEQQSESARFAWELIDVLHAVAPHLSAGRRFAVVEALRALPPAGPGGPPRPGTAASTLTLLRQLDAVLVRPDLDRALAAAHLGADPWRAAPAVLREAFGVPVDEVMFDEPALWRAELTESVRTPEALAEFRERAAAAGAGGLRVPGAEGAGVSRAPGVEGVGRPPAVPGSRDLLVALIEAYPGAPLTVQARLVDWMTELQPLDAPEWTIAETWAAGAAAGVPSRPVRADDLDQPRSAAQRVRLLGMLDAGSPERRTAAALALRGWPEPEVSRTVLRAYLRGRVDVLPETTSPELLAHLEVHGPGALDREVHGPGALDREVHGPDASRPEAPRLEVPRHRPSGPQVSRPEARLPDSCRGELTAPGVLPERALRWVTQLPEDELPPLVPLIVGWWEHGPPAVHGAARTALRRVPADTLAHLLAPRIEAGELGLLDLLAGLRLLRTPTLTRAERLLRTEGREAPADALVLLDGPLRTPGAAHEDIAALASLRTPSRAAAAPADPPSLPELLDLARTGTPEQIRGVLTRLVEEHAPAPGTRPGPELRALVEELLRHPGAGVRLHAHRTSRALFDRDAHARLTALLLSDPLPEVVRMAVRTLGRAAWEPALPDLVRLLGHAKPAVRRAARDALIGFGGAALPVLRRAEAHARPDRRSLYTDMLAEIAGGGA
ncbi:HEAT repeat domain-containing protein, partial [Streptomyces sp. NPDC058375]|uniref:HEAT repeat domain-containing protein n=1 Tax=Streptomyces sp. NPDC058375 TaxID=3346467 RepID=UPI00365333F6